MMNLSGAIIAPIENSSSGTSDIYLPNQSDDITGVAVDIGGSLSKVVYFSRRMDDTTMNGGRMHFERFHTHSIEDLIEFLRPLIADNIKRGMRPRIKATGGGAHKFADLFRERLGVLLEAEDEMQCLIRGLNFLLREVSCEVFSYDDSSTATAGHTFQEVRDPRTMFPYMLVNIGSGVSILKVTSESTFERIGGTSLGGGTLWGLLSLLTDCRDFDEMLEMSTRGDNRNVDMLVGDIYGSDYKAIGLKATTIASSFGKMWQRGTDNKGRTQASQEDICKSALLMVSNNIAQIAFLTARYHQIETIYFGGSFIRGHADTMKTISYGVNFWSAGAMKALFLRHDGYLGCLGAFLTGEDHIGTGSFMENFSRSGAFAAQPVHYVGVLDTMPEYLVPFPLIARPDEYVPDTVALDEESLRNEWLDIFTKSNALVVQAIKSAMGDTPDIAAKSDAFVSAFNDILLRIRQQPGAYGPLSVQLLLRLQEQCLHEFVSRDPMHDLKQRHNEHALANLPTILAAYDALHDRKQLLRTLVRNLLYGDRFDWNSRINKADESPEHMLLASFSAQEGGADMARFVERLHEGPAYKRAMMFVNNSGVDVVLCTLPFARALLQQGTEVVLAANTYPAADDITHRELAALVGRLASTDKVFAAAIASQRLTCVPTGTGSVCINLFRVDSRLAEAAASVDLLVLQGAGRALHTNLRTRFSCDTIKAAYVKDNTIANYLGVTMHDVVLRFEVAADADKEGRQRAAAAGTRADHKDITPPAIANVA